MTSLLQEEGCSKNNLYQPAELWPCLGDRGCLALTLMGLDNPRETFPISALSWVLSHRRLWHLPSVLQALQGGLSQGGKDGWSPASDCSFP